MPTPKHLALVQRKTWSWTRRRTLSHHAKEEPAQGQPSGNKYNVCEKQKQPSIVRRQNSMDDAEHAAQTSLKTNGQKLNQIIHIIVMWSTYAQSTVLSRNSRLFRIDFSIVRERSTVYPGKMHCTMHLQNRNGNNMHCTIQSWYDAVCLMRSTIQAVIVDLSRRIPSRHLTGIVYCGRSFERSVDLTNVGARVISIQSVEKPMKSTGGAMAWTLFWIGMDHIIE